MAASTFEKSSRVAAPADALVEKMIDPEQQQIASLHFGAKAARCRREVLSDHRVKIELELDEVDRRTGKIVTATISMEWDLARRECRWTRRDHTYGDRVKASGFLSVEPAGESACVMRERGEIEVRIPLLGGRIAKKVAAAMQRKQPQKAAYWEKLLASQNPLTVLH